MMLVQITLKQLKTRTHVAVTDASGALTINVTDTVATLCSGGGGHHSLLKDDVGPDYTLKQLTADDNIAIENTTVVLTVAGADIVSSDDCTTSKVLEIKPTMQGLPTQRRRSMMWFGYPCP